MSNIEASPCDHRRLLGCASYHSQEERAWYERHEPWLRDQLENGTTRWADEPAFIVDRALDWLFEQAQGAEPGWEVLDIRKLLLEELPLGGIPDYFGSRDVLLGLKEFLEWMGQNGKLAPATATRLANEIDACQEDFLDYFGDTESKEMSKGLSVQLSSMDNPGEAWLSCLHCYRFFQAKDLRPGFDGRPAVCPFPDCGAAGLDIDIHAWDAFRNNRDPNWPASTDELRHGMKVP